MIYPLDQDTLGGVRYPRAFLKINDARIPLHQCRVSRKATQHADTFSAELSITKSAVQGFDLATWADWPPDQDVSIMMSTAADQSDMTVMITGKIDMPSIDMEAFTVSIQGRDKSASLTEKKRSDKFQNNKSSEIVEKIAKDHGLNPVIVDSGDYAGKTYSTDETVHVMNRTDFETLSMLSDREGYRFYVEGDNLIFEPKESGSYGTFTVYWRPPSSNETAYSNAVRLKLGKNCTAARPHEVTGAGWHHGDKRLYKSVAKASGEGSPLYYRFHHNGNRQSQLDKKMKSRLADLIRHELEVSVEMPGDLTVDPHMALQIVGTGTIYDATFQIDTVDFDFGWDNGLDMTIEAKGARPGRTE